jgi:peptidyl-prolyl cis-trans isomerase C
MTPLRLGLCAASLLGLALPFAPAPAQDRVATVNGVAIPKSRIDLILKAQAQRGTPESPQLRGDIRDRLILREVVAQEAARKGITKSGEVQAQLDLARQEVIWNAYVADFVKNNPVPDAQLKAEYDKQKAIAKEYKARHILVEKKEEAEAIIVDLKKGRKFEDLAKQSKDQGSKDRGGDLDWNAPSSYVPQFAEALLRLEKGKYTEAPVQTQFGWHVILVEDVRPATKFPSYDEAKPRLTEWLQQQAFTKNVNGLRAKAKIE